MKSFNLISLAAVSALLVACGPSTVVKGELKDTSGAEVIVKILDVNAYTVLDTVKTKADGSFKFSVPVVESDPEFVYLFYKDTKVASLLLTAGETAVVEADTLGQYSVSGSEESIKLKEVEDRFAAFIRDVRTVDDPSLFVRKYIDYYRESVKYILTNPYSLTVIPVMYQKLSPDAPIFSQSTDAIHFRNVCDSLKTVYPESRYVKALERESSRRESQFKLENEIKNASSIGFPDLNMPGIDGNKIALSSVKSKVILLHFWNSADAGQNNFTQEILTPIYRDYHDRGLEIYSVCLDTDKVRWASVVNGQKLPWINVNDGLGAASPSYRLYNVGGLPDTILIADGTVNPTAITGVAGLRKELSRLL